MITNHHDAAITIPREFFELLQQQLQNSEVMLSLLSEEKIALLEMNTSALLSLSKRKEHQLSLIQNLDETLTDLAKKIAEEFGLKASGLSSLGSHLPSQEAEKLAAFRKKLTRMQEEILSKNLINKKFAEETKVFFGDAISLITGALQSDPGYTTKGLIKPPKNQPTFISREV